MRVCFALHALREGATSSTGGDDGLEHLAAPVDRGGQRPPVGRIAGRMYAAIEAGGTKFVVAVGERRDQLELERFSTRDPESTLADVLGWLRARGPFTGVGIGAFGPIDPDPASPRYGTLGATPKPGWAGFPLGARIGDALGAPWRLDTDVNAAAVAEGRWGAARGLGDFLYVTVGTGIGGGAVSGGRLVHGLLHPEMGHVLLPPQPDDPFAGHCPFHGRCLEGMAAGPAIEARWGVPASTLAPDHPAWDLEARHLAAGMHALACVLSPERIVLGGGVMEVPGLLERTRAHLEVSLAGYLELPEDFLVGTGLDGVAGLYGAFALAQDAALT